MSQVQVRGPLFSRKVLLNVADMFVVCVFAGLVNQSLEDGALSPSHSLTAETGWEAGD